MKWNKIIGNTLKTQMGLHIIFALEASSRKKEEKPISHTNTPNHNHSNQRRKGQKARKNFKKVELEFILSYFFSSSFYKCDK